MRIRSLFSRPTLSLVLLLLAACGDSDSSLTPPQVDARDTAAVLIPKTTKVLNSDAASSLIEIDSARLVFRGSSSAASELSVGDVVVAGITPATPHGLLRKLTGKQVQSERIVFSTRAAKLTEAIERGKGSISVPLELADSIQGQIEPGLFLSRVGRNGFQIKFDGLNIKDIAKITGTFSTAPMLDLDLDLDDWTLKTFAFKIKVTNSAQVALEALGVKGALGDTLTIREFKLRPVVLSIGIVPVVIIPSLKLQVGAEGVISAGIVASATASESATQGLRYQDGSWTPITEYERSNTWQKPQFTADANAKAFLGPRFEVAMYDAHVLNGYIDLHGQVRTEITFMQDPRWKLLWGVESNLGLSSSLFDPSFVDFNKTTILREEWLLASGYKVTILPEKMDTAKVDSTYTFTARMKAVPKQAKYTWNFGDGTASVVRMNDSTVTHAFSKDGTYTISVGVYDEEKRQEVADDTAFVTVGSTASYEDAFETNSLAQYTHYDLSNTTGVWSISGGYLIGQGNADQSVLIRNGFVAADGYVEAILDRADDAGLAFRFQDARNYYLLAIRDDESSKSAFRTANLQFYKGVNGTFYAMSHFDVVWPRGRSVKVRVEFVGSTFKVYLDGSLVGTVADTSYASGGVGARHMLHPTTTTSVSSFDVLRWGTLR